MAKIQLGVIFGSRSCEREVSIISAIQLMNHVNTDVYDVIPVYISETGIWYTGNKLRDIRTFQHFQPDQNGIERVILDTTAGSGALLAHESAPAAHGRFLVHLPAQCARTGCTLSCGSARRRARKSLSRGGL